MSRDRLLRSPVVCCVLAVILVPVLLLSAFGGTTLIAHTHDGHDVHLHASLSIEGARRSAEQHRLAHASGVAECGEHHPDHADHDHPDTGAMPGPVSDQDGVLITLPDHEQLLSRGVDLASVLQTAKGLECACAWFWTFPDVSEDVGSPGGLREGRHGGGCALHLSSLTAVGRLVHTSGALLL